MDNLFENQPDANQVEGTSEPQDNSQETQTEATTKVEASTQDEKPFHEHPRFKELIDERNKFREEMEAQKKQYADLERQMRSFSQQAQPQAKPKNAALEELREIKPELASYIENTGSAAEKVAALENQLAEMRRQTLINQYESAVNTLYTSNNVSESLRPIYNTLIKNAVVEANSQLSDVPAVFSKIHGQMSQLIEGIKKETTKSYSEGKKQDASAPKIAPKGAPVKTGKVEYSRDPAQRKSQMIQAVLKQVKASSSI